jgi:hypothetical protein
MTVKQYCYKKQILTNLWGDPNRIRYNQECFLVEFAMPDLTHALQGNDLGFLRIVANAWRLELDQPDAATALPVLVSGMKNPALLKEVVSALSIEVQEALQTLMENEGKLGWAMFCRRFGDVRPMGPGKRDRERPDVNNPSITEVLFYRALIAKAFFNRPPEPQEYAYIPDDLVEYFDFLTPNPHPPLGRPASPNEKAVTIPATDRILDHTCTLLAALRTGLPLEPFEGRWPVPLPVLLSLLNAAGLIDANQQIQTEAVRVFLEASRGNALAQLSRAWQKSTAFNELRLLPGLCFEGAWDNLPLQVRQTLLNVISHLPQDNWWSLNALVAGMKEKLPDFQRPGGDYDSWFIRQEGSDKFLRGFETWDLIDGALIRFLVTGPLYWLGWYDLAAPAEGAAATAFRPSAWAAELWQGKPPGGLPVENIPLRITSGGRLRIPTLAPRSARYQIARFCEWESETAEEYRFKIAPASLERARQQGLKTGHLLALLRRYAAPPLPPTLVQGLERWEKLGAQATLEQAILLRLASAEMLAALRQSRAARYLGDTLSPTVVIVKPGGEEAIRQALAELGYLAEEHV